REPRRRQSPHRNPVVMTPSAPPRRPHRAIVIAFAALAAACGDTSKGTSTGTGSAGAKDAGAGTILIGEYGSMTGSEANFGKSTHNGVMLAVEEQNAKGGVNGKKLEVRSLDD